MRSVPGRFAPDDGPVDGDLRSGGGPTSGAGPTAGGVGSAAPAGRGFTVGVVLRDVSKQSALTEAFLDTPLGGISILFDGDQPVGLSIGGPSKGLAVGVSTPGFPSYEKAVGVTFPTDLSPFLFPRVTGPSGLRGLVPPTIGRRK